MDAVGWRVEGVLISGRSQNMCVVYQHSHNLMSLISSCEALCNTAWVVQDLRL